MPAGSRAPIHTPWRYGIALFAWFALCALVRSIDHDESQYVAATVLTAHGYLPFRDFAYLQTPLQPFVFAPLVWLSGPWAWPVLRLANAALGTAIVGCVWRAAREAGAGPHAALLAAGMLAVTDILLFCLATARNDALPAALLAAALIPIIRAEQGRGSAGSAALIGLLLSAATAAKISYAIPAAAYGVYALSDRRHRPLVLLAGALPVLGFLGWTFALAPEAFWFGTVRFPALAPAEFYVDRPWKMSFAAKTVDAIKFLALGPALLALVVVGLRRQRHRVMEALLFAGFVAALLPFPTWRQYLLPAIPPLFVLLALAWDARLPGRALRICIVVTACAGLATTVASMIGSAGDPWIALALREGLAIRAGLDRAGVSGPVATLSPEFLPRTGRLSDPRFAAGPFYFRSSHLLGAAAEARFHLVSGARMDDLDRHPPLAVLVGGEAPWTAGDTEVDAVLEHWAIAHRYRAMPIASRRFRLYVKRP